MNMKGMCHASMWGWRRSLGVCMALSGERRASGSLCGFCTPSCALFVCVLMHGLTGCSSQMRCDPQVHHNASTVCLLTTTCRQAGTLPSPRSHMNRALSSARAPAAPLVLWQRCVEKGTKMAATHMSAFAVKVCCTEVLQWRDPTLGSQEPKYQQTLHLSPKRWRKGD